MRRYTLVLITLVAFAKEPNTEVKAYLETLATEVKKENPNFKNFDVKRGEQIFTSKHIGKKGSEIACISCHNSDLTTSGKNVNTSKIIEPLAPSVNSNRISDVKEVQKWLKRNFGDVYNREGSSLEKGDVLVYILSK